MRDRARRRAEEVRLQCQEFPLVSCTNFFISLSLSLSFSQELMDVADEEEASPHEEEEEEVSELLCCVLCCC